MPKSLSTFQVGGIAARNVAEEGRFSCVWCHSHAQFFLKEFKEAVLKQKIGFLVLKLGEKEEGRYLYPTVLYHLALRSRIKRELETGKVLGAAAERMRRK